METFKVKILQARKRIGIKEISAPSIDIAEKYLVKLLQDFIKVDASNLVYVVKNENEILLKVLLFPLKYSIHIYK